MKIYLINLDSATERLTFQQKQMKTLGLEFERFRAQPVDELSPEQIKAAYKKWKWKRPAALWEISLTYNHFALHQKIAQNNQPALILEDDALLSKDVPQILQSIEQMNFQGDCIYLEGSWAKAIVAKKAHSLIYKNFNLVKLYFHEGQSASYILYPKGAHRLLEFSKKNFLPSDRFIGSQFNELNYHLVEPTPIKQIEAFRKEWQGLERKDVSWKSRLKMVKHGLQHRQAKSFFRWISLFMPNRRKCKTKTAV